MHTVSPIIFTAGLKRGKKFEFNLFRFQCFNQLTDGFNNSITVGRERIDKIGNLHFTFVKNWDAGIDSYDYEKKVGYIFS